MRTAGPSKIQVPLARTEASPRRSTIRAHASSCSEDQSRKALPIAKFLGRGVSISLQDLLRGM